MTFAWAYLGSDGEHLGSSEEFADRESAEQWMGQSWEDLLQTGVAEVALVDRDRDRRVYRMGLAAS